MFGRVNREARSGDFRDRHVQCSARFLVAVVPRGVLDVAVPSAEGRFSGNDIDGSAQCIAAANRALRTHVHFHALQVEEGDAKPARPWDVDIIEVRVYRRIAELRVGVAADAADIELDVIFVVGDLHTGQQRRQVDEVPQSQGIEFALGGGNRRARIALQRLRDALDRDDDLLERLLPWLCLGRLLGENNGRRTEQGASDGSRQRPENSHFLVPC